MDRAAAINPWITISKKKRNRTPTPGQSPVHETSKVDIDPLQTNNFTELSLEDESSDELTPNNTDPEPPNGAVQSTGSPGMQSPPRKKSKKDPKVLFLLGRRLSQKSHYPRIKVRENAINRQVGLTV
jgi:hypothetical protein